LTESDWERVRRGEEEDTLTIDKEENHPIMCMRVWHVRTFDPHLSVLYIE